MPLLAIELLLFSGLWTWYSWKNPTRAFVGLPILLPAYLVRTSIGPLPTTGLELLILATAAGWLLQRGRKGLRDAWKACGAWRPVLVVWMLAGLVGVIVSPVTLQALGLYRAYFIEPVLIFLIGFDLIRTNEDRRNLAMSASLITILLGIWAAVQMLTGWGIPDPWNVWPGRRATGPFPFPNALALFVAPIAALAFADLVRRRGKVATPDHRPDENQSSPVRAQRIAPDQETLNASLLPPTLGWLTVGAGLAAILMARSDGGLVALLAAMFLALLLHAKTRRYAIGGAIGIVIFILAFAPLRTRVGEVLLFKEWSGKVRTIIWKETWTMLTDTSTPAGLARPLLGAGLAAYPTVILPYHKATWMEVFQYPHNIFLNLWSETGILGMIAFAFILWRWGSLGQQQVVLPVIAAILVHGLVDVPYFKNDLAVMFWILILMTNACHTISYDKGNASISR